jgi:IclR family mhp operon transcriptional activator
MLVRETSQSPLSIEPHGAGETVPMLTSAAGRAFLAFCAPKTREAVVDVLTQSQAPADRLARDRVALERLLQETRSQGFGLAQRARRVSEETSLALPIQSGEDVLAALSVRFAATAVPQRSAIEQFLPKMREFARAIEAEFSQTRR